jgi:spore germination cell wall hydrolase CwlJ-like protein
VIAAKTNIIKSISISLIVLFIFAGALLIYKRTYNNFFVTDSNDDIKTKFINIYNGNIENIDNVLLLARIVSAEVPDGSYNLKTAIASVIVNRSNIIKFTDSIINIACSIKQNSNKPLSESDINAARDAIDGYDITSGSLYFWNLDKTKKDDYESHTITLIIDNYVFGV